MKKKMICAGFAAMALAGCGGGGGNGGSAPTGSTSSGTGASATPAPIALLGAPGLSAAGALTPTGDVVNDSLAFMNNMRAQLGLSALTYEPAVSQAAANHAIYLQDNNQSGHYETAGLPGYTAYSPADRVAMYYSTNSVGEIAADIGGPFTSSTEAVSALFDAPFHRAIVLFDTQGVGIGQGAANTNPAAFSTFVADFVDYVQKTPDSALIAYPYNGEANVSPSWVANESPNPFANAPQYEGQTVGYPITLSAAGNGAFSNVAFAITSAAGVAIPCQETDNSNNSEATRLAMCVPFEPLAANTTYTVTVTGSLTNTSIPTPQAFSVSWSFATGAAAAVANAQQAPGSQAKRLPTILNSVLN